MFQRSIMVLAIGVLTTAATAQAQFAGNTAADTTREGLAGVWGGFALCKSTPTGYAVFTEITEQDGRYTLNYMYVSTNKWSYSYDAVALGEGRFLLAPTGEGSVIDARLIDGRLEWTGRTNDCRYSFYPLSALPEGVSF